MLLLWVTLLVLHRGYSLVPVVTVQPGEPATFKCVLPKELGSGKVHWYRQSTGDTLKLIVILLTSTNPQYTPEFNKSRIKATHDEEFSNLTIVRTTEGDEGMYHCVVMQFVNTEWSGTYLLVKGNSQRTSNYTVVQQPTVSGPVRPGDSVTLQCSVLSDSEDKMCPANHSVYWFRAGSHESHPDVIYTDGNGPDKCDNRPDSLKSCIYRFSKTISSSDAGTYYCAVATCGEILFGDGTKLIIEEQRTHSLFIALGILIVCLAISVAGNAALIYQRAHKGMESATSEAGKDDSCQQEHDSTGAADQLNYAALNFSQRKATRGRNNKEFAEDSVYSAVRC